MIIKKRGDMHHAFCLGTPTHPVGDGVPDVPNCERNGYPEGHT